jgi:hypothetical protein
MRRPWQVSISLSAIQGALSAIRHPRKKAHDMFGIDGKKIKQAFADYESNLAQLSQLPAETKDEARITNIEDFIKKLQAAFGG